MLLILTQQSDAHVTRIIPLLEGRGVSYVRVDPAHVSQGFRLSWWSRNGGYWRIALPTGGIIDSREVTTIWFRRPGLPSAPPAVNDPAVRELLTSEHFVALTNLWSVTEHADWIPAAPHVLQLAGCKLRQLKVAADLGFTIPDTLFTSDPEALFEFYRGHNGQLISKVLGQYLTVGPLGREYVRYTEPLVARDLGHAEDLRLCPMIFQEYVSKVLEIRVTVFGDKVHAVQIDSQRTQRTRHDWRRYDLTRTPHAVHVLPPTIERLCVALTRQLGLRFGAIDLILSPSAGYVFVEINPNGQFFWLEEMTGLPLGQAMIDLLVSR